MASFHEKTSTIVLLLFVLFPTVAVGQEEEMTQNQFVITPRIWLASYGAPQDEGRLLEGISLPMFGATLSYTSKARPNVSYMATILRGSGNGRVLDPFDGLGRQDITRTDTELLARYALSEPKVYVLAGLRYVSFETRAAWGAYREFSTVKVMGGELGFGFTQDITQGSPHQVFGNIVGLLATTDYKYKDTLGGNDNSTFFAPGVDLNVGYQYRITPSVHFSARYRAFIYQFGGQDTFTDTALFHGLELGLSIAM